jgi:stearoyl-CoA desaturase (Delta-9 desaturase)
MKINSNTDRKSQLIVRNEQLRAKQKNYGLAVVLVPVLGVVFSIPITFWLGVSSIDIGLFILMLMLSTIGIEVGFHRYFSHGAFRTNTTVEVILAILGCMTGEGPPLYWVANHRRHHQYSDRQGDPHSPNLLGSGIRNRLYGLWHAHLGWILDLELTNTVLYAKDLLRNPVLTQVNKYYFLWLAAGLIIPAVLGGILTKTWTGFLSGFLWGGIIRLFIAQQITYCVNSLCHVFGSRPLTTDDRSMNIAWLAPLTFGGSWHNNHHAFPQTAINQFEWWQIDLGGWFIRLLELCGLVSNVNMPTSEMIQFKKITK